MRRCDGNRQRNMQITAAVLQRCLKGTVSPKPALLLRRDLGASVTSDKRKNLLNTLSGSRAVCAGGTCTGVFKWRGFEMWCSECKYKLGKQIQRISVGNLRVFQELDSWVVNLWAWQHQNGRNPRWLCQPCPCLCSAVASLEVPGWCLQRALQHSQWNQHGLWSKVNT